MGVAEVYSVNLLFYAIAIISFKILMDITLLLYHCFS